MRDDGEVRRRVLAQLPDEVGEDGRLAGARVAREAEVAPRRPVASKFAQLTGDAFSRPGKEGARSVGSERLHRAGAVDRFRVWTGVVCLLRADDAGPDPVGNGLAEA